jgi:hypothetical protein
MPYDSDFRRPIFVGLVYRSRINDIINMSDSDAIGSFSIAELDTQYNNVVDLDEIESRTFDADSDGIVRGFTDFSNTINTMDENHWLQIDSDGSGNNMLGYVLDFANERPGTPNPPIFSIETDLEAGPSIVSASGTAAVVGIGSLVSGASTVDGVADDKHIGSGALVTTESIVTGVADDKHIGSGTLVTTASLVVGTTRRDVNSISATLVASDATVAGIAEIAGVALGVLEAQASTVVGASERAVTSTGTLQAQVVTVDGLAIDNHSASGTLESQVSTVEGFSGIRPSVTGSGALIATPSTVVGLGITTEPYVGMPFPAVYVGMPFPAIYVGGVIQPE